MKAVFDTNVLIAAFLTEGICAKLLIRARKRDFDLIICDAILKEFAGVMKKKFTATSSETAEALAILTDAAFDIRGRIDPIAPICRDPDDDLILACAGEAVADYIVTGDEDLLVLKTYRTTDIINPRAFEKLFLD